MGKLHELVSIEKDRKLTLKRIMEEALVTFTKRAHHFDGETRKYLAFDENDKDLPEETHKPVVTTVQDKLDYIEKPFVNVLDLVLQKEYANSDAKGDIKIGDNVIVTDVPVSALLQIENHLVMLRQLFQTIPTLVPDHEWKKDETKVNIYKTENIESTRTKKISKALVLHPPTKEHPAQTQLVSVDEVVGKWIKIFSSSRITPAEKSKKLDRVETLLNAVKKARARANDMKVEKKQIGNELFKFING